MFREISQLRTQAASEDARLASYQATLASVSATLDRMKLVQSDRLFSSRDQVTRLYRVVDSLCNTDGLQLDEITPSLEETIAFLKQDHRPGIRARIPVQITVRGKYSSLARLSDNIQKLEHYRETSRCQVSGSRGMYPQCLMILGFLASVES